MLESKSIVSQFSKVIAEHLFVQIPEQVEWLDRNVSALKLALEKAPEVLQSVGVDLPVNVAFGMVHDAMLEVLVLQHIVGREIVRVDRGVGLDVTVNLRFNNVSAASRNYGSANFAAAFENAHDGSLVFAASGSDSPLVFFRVHIASFAADESLIYFDFATGTAQLDERAGLHRKANPVQHEPCGLLSDAKSAGHFVGTNSVLTVGNHPNRNKPLVQRQRQNPQRWSRP